MTTIAVSRESESLTQTARAIFLEALASCGVEQAFHSKFFCVPSREHAFTLRGAPDEPVAEIDLGAFDRVLVIASGKGSAAMLASLLSRLRPPPGCAVSGVLIASARPRELPPGIEFVHGGHPLPTAESLRGAQAALQLLRRAAAQPDSARTFCFFLISGGGSAMMELPLDGSIALEDTVAFHRALVHSGASIAEINCVRKHFSAVKGGRLGQLAASLQGLTILVSDVPAGCVDALASGPTVPDSSTVAECREILARHKLLEKFPAAVRLFFESPHLPETPKPGDFPAHVVTLLSDADLAEAARRHAESLGFAAFVDNTCDDWDYRDAAEYLIAKFRGLRQRHTKACLISVGEVTVQVARPSNASEASLGGRNQHFALHAATLLQPSDHPTAVFSAGSDGIDGNSPFAGAALDAALLQTAEPQAAIDALARFDSATFLHRLGATLETGATGNNLRDLRIMLAG